MPLTANDGTSGKERLAARIRGSWEFNSEVGKDKTFCTE
jgi:hypothetical protein